MAISLQIVSFDVPEGDLAPVLVEVLRAHEADVYVEAQTDWPVGDQGPPHSRYAWEPQSTAAPGRAVLKMENRAAREYGPYAAYVRRSADQPLAVQTSFQAMRTYTTDAVIPDLIAAINSHLEG